MIESRFKKVRSRIVENRKKRDAGQDLCISWKRFPKLSSVLPGVQRGRYYIITSGPKAGKTQLTDNLFVLEPIDYMINNPHSNLKLKVYYFSLEMSADDKIAQLISNKLFRETGEAVTPENLQSLFSNYVVDDDIINTLHEPAYEEWFDFLENTVTFVDHVTNPTGIWKYMQEIARQNGKFYFQGVEIPTPPGTNMRFQYDQYIPNDPELVIEVICDHVGLLTEEEGAMELKDGISRYSKYCIKMRNNWGMTPINVHQQALGTEEKAMFNGKVIVSKVKPTHAGLGDSKVPSRDCDVILGLFNPSRFEIDMYPEKNGYDIVNQWGNHFRELSILLNRRGGEGVDLALYFHGGVNEFAELPPPEAFKSKQLYTQYLLE